MSPTLDNLKLDNASFKGGYPGVEKTKDKIKLYIPNSKLYVEPFVGLGRTVEITKHEKIILNDMSDYSNQYCADKFPSAEITHMDFRDCIDKYDSQDTFFLIDPPWETRTYRISDKMFCNMKAQEYYKILLYYVQNKIKGNWIILSKATNSPTKNWAYNKIIVESDLPCLFGQKARTMLTSNIKLEIK